METNKISEYFKFDQMASHAWQGKYQMKDTKGNPLEKTPTDMHIRLAQEFGNIEKFYQEKENISKVNDLSEFGQQFINKRASQTKEEIVDELFSYFDKFKYIVPQGSIMSNLGNKYVFGSLSNCFGIAPPEDSYGGILRADEELAQLMKRRGGVGTHLNTLRPTSALVSNSANSSTGVPSFANRYSNTTREVAQDGRRGALMLLLSCKHPDIFKWVTMKDDLTKVTGANVSVMFTDEFMKAVEEDSKYFICTFPTDIQIEQIHLDAVEFEDYNKLIFISKEYGYVMKINPKELFNLVVEMAWKNAEPGVAFIDRIKDYSPDGVYTMYEPELCNPCGEQWFHAYDTCRLIALNLFSVIDNPFTKEAKLNEAKLYEISYMQQRLGDDLVDLEIQYIDRIINKIKSDPEQLETKQVELELWHKVKAIAKGGRRTGNGFTALGDMIAAMGYQYQSKEALALVEQAMRIKMQAELDCTIDLAVLRGTFDGCNPELEYGVDKSLPANSFYEMLLDEFPIQANRMYQFGRRNVSWSTVAPTGTVSLMTQTTSGLEPLFKAYYIRRKKINPGEEGVRVDFTDQNGDSWQEYSILHPKFKEWIELSIKGIEVNNLSKDQIEVLFKNSPWYGSEADDISWEARVNMNSIIQKYTSNALSCTINLPNNISKETVANIYFEGWKKGLKGVTVYRDGSRSGVLITDNSKATTDEFGYTDSLKRPKELDADYYFVTSKGRKYAVIVGLLNGNPYELFAFENPLEEQHLKGKITKAKKGIYKFSSLNPNYTIENLQLSSEHSDERLLTRFVSGMLRHGMNPKYIVDQINKSELSIVNFGKAISRVLSKYVKEESVKEKCPQCQQDALIKQEGCTKCTNCGYSKCS